MDPHTQRAEAERWLGIAAKLMTARDFLGSKTFAMRAREADPNNPVSDQILAVIETILAGEKRVNASQQPDWYSILQLPRLARDPDQIADHYRRLVLCLNPERNRFPFADYALQLVMDAWSVLSDPTKKWLFDNELALFSQQHQPQPQQQTDASAAAAAAAAGGGQLNTFQFFQQQPQQPQPQQPQQQQQQPMWQLQQPQQQQQQQQHHPQQQQQINQREFMPLPQVQPQSSQQQQQPQHHHQQVPPQWQMRDPTPIKSGGERNKQVLNGIGGGVSSSTNIPPSPMIPTQAAATTTTTMRPVPQAPQPAPPPVPQPQPQPSPQTPVLAARVTVASVGNVVDGNSGIIPNTANNDNNNNNDVSNINNDVNDSNVNGVGDTAVVDEDNDEGVVEEGDCFWTACPYCFYIYEYLKVYQDCTLRCQNCRKAFHAVQIPNPPPVSSNNGKEKEKEKGKGKGKEKENEKKENSFCCWGFFPLGFSMTAWKKQQNRGGNMNGSSNWVPFSPMFTSPAANGGGNFQWFDNGGGNAHVGPKHAPAKSTPRVYIDDDDDEFLELSESSDMDSSDGDWRNYNQEKTKGKKRRRRRGNVGGRRKGRPPKSDVVKPVNQNVASGGGVSVGGEALADGATNAQEVVFSLAAGDKPNSSKSIPASLTRKQTRRSVKDVGRLDLNVEFNNDGEEHAPAVSAVNGEEDGIENIAFFDGLDEFLSTLPILNVGGDEKAKPS